MIRRILVGLDGSPASEQSLPWTTRLAPGARLTLLRAYLPVFPGTDPWMSDAAFTAESNALAEKAILKDLGRIAKRLEPKPKTMARPGSGAGALLNTAHEHRFDLIAITTRGGQSLKRRILGGTPEQLLHQSNIPLLVVPVSPKARSTARKIRRIAIPLDGSGSAERILPMAERIARENRAELLLIHVLRSLEKLQWESGIWAGGLPESAASDAFGEAVGRLETSLRRRLDDVVLALGRKGIRAKSVIVRGEVPEAFLRACSNRSCDLITMCVHGHGAIQHLLQGSMASRILQNTRIPVLLVRDDKAKPRRR